MNALAIDASTESLNLYLQSGSASLSFSLRMGYRHAETLVPWIERLLRQGGVEGGDLDLVICSSGPGSFTGLRIGLATAKGLAAGADCGIVGVPTLDAWAWGHRMFPGTVVPLIDARKRRVYAAIYREGRNIDGYMDISPETLIEKLRLLDSPLLLTGPYAGDLDRIIDSAGLPRRPRVDPFHFMMNPAFLLQKGLELYAAGGSHGDTLVPLYLRRSEAEVKRRR